MPEKIRNNPWRAAFVALLLCLGVFVAREALAGVPTREGALFNDAVSADTDLFEDDIRPPESHPTCAYRVQVQVATATKLMLVVRSGATSKVGPLNVVNNSGTLVAGAPYTFVVLAARASDAGEAMAINFQLDDAVTLDYLIVDRVVDGAL